MSQVQTEVTKPSKREQELELEVWRARMREAQLGARALQAESQLIAINARECQGKIAELEASIKALTEPAPTMPLKAVEG